MSNAPNYTHGTALLVGEAGILIRGASGSGKSTLARTLLDEAGLRGHFAALIGDDVVSLSAHGGRLICAGHPEIRGRIEVAGFAILDVAHERRAVLRLIVDYVEHPVDRLPEAAATTIDGVTLPVLQVERHHTVPFAIVEHALALARAA